MIKEKKKNNKLSTNDLKIKLEKLFSEKYGEIIDKNLEDLKLFPSGNISFDYIIGGGVPEGKLIEIYGSPGSGKTTIALQIAATIQKKFKQFVSIIDIEQAKVASYWKALGINDELLFNSPTPKTAEECMALILDLIESGIIKCIILDSIATLVPAAEYNLKEDATQNKMATLARVLSSSLKRIVSALHKHKVTLICINQLRSTMQSVGRFTLDTTPGGNALKFLSFMRIEMKRREYRKTGEDITGAIINVRAVKNRIASPFKKKQVEIYFGDGFDKFLDVINLSEELEIVKKKGAWYYMDDAPLGQKKILYKKLKNNEDELFTKISNIIIEKLNNTSSNRFKLDIDNYL